MHLEKLFESACHLELFSRYVKDRFQGESLGICNIAFVVHFRKHDRSLIAGEIEKSTSAQVE